MYIKAQKIKYLNIIKNMAKYGLNRKDVAKKLHINPLSFNRRLWGEKQWKAKEIDILLDMFNETYEELFRVEEE